MSALQVQLEHLPEYLSRHILLVVTSLTIGVGLSLPLAVAVTRIRALHGPVLGAASMVQTIPSLALLALMVPLLDRIGVLPATIALVLYSMLPVIRNTVTGIDGVDRNVIEAGRGIGMTSWQLLVKVELPLAAPVIIAGIRTATVWVVGIATLSTPVGATSLGNYIFSGLQTQNDVAVLVGCVAAAALALLLDAVIRVLELAAVRRSRGLLLAGAAGVAIVLGGGLTPLALDLARADDRPPVRIGAKTFTEQYILAALLANGLEEAGYRPRRLESLGSTVAFDALVAGEIDCYVDYTGTIWATLMNRDGAGGADEVFAEVSSWLEREHAVTCVGRLGFENTYALAMRRERAEELGIRTIDDLAGHAGSMRVGGDYEFFGRPEWPRLGAAYGLAFGETVSMDGSLMYRAIARDELDVIGAFSTDGRIAAHDLVILDDVRDVFPPYDAVILVGPDAARDAKLVEALGRYAGTIDGDAMRRANMAVDVDGASAEAAARALAGGE